MIPIPPAVPVLRNISHAAHAIATLLTLGLWAPMWLIASVVTSRTNKAMQREYALKLARYNWDLFHYSNTENRF